MITFEGKKYKVISDLGYQHSDDAYAKRIMIDGEEKIIVKRGKTWRLAKPIILFGKPICGQYLKQSF